MFHASEDLKKEIIANRRALHQRAEIAFDLPETRAYVSEKLKEYGYEPEEMGGGITCTVGKGGKTILLRADMDALPMKEESGLDFACTTGNCHSCGHDCHAAMLLGAAKVLKEMEGELKGTVKFMFQPAEEVLGGAAAMVEAGILENPKVDAAFGIHVSVGREDSCTGTVLCTHGTMNNSGDAIKITVKGKDAHGSQPQLGIDSISIASRIVIALEELTAKEIPTKEDSVVLVGKIVGGTTCNTVAGTTEMEISVRTQGHQERAYLKRRVKEIAEGIAAAFRATAEVEYQYGMPPLVNDETMMNEFLGYMKEFLPADQVKEVEEEGGCEDFTVVSEKVPAVFMMLGAGDKGSGHIHGMHHPAMQVDEDALPVGTEIYVNCAVRWLEDHSC